MSIPYVTSCLRPAVNDMDEEDNQEDVFDAEASKALEAITNQDQPNDDDDFDFEKEGHEQSGKETIAKDDSKREDETRRATRQYVIKNSGRQAVATAPGVEVGRWEWFRAGLG